jgi:anaerobic selenocysteine-containing dehydrogenase
MSEKSNSESFDRSRRKFLKASGITAAAGVISAYLPVQASNTLETEVSGPTRGCGSNHAANQRYGSQAKH